MGDGALVVALEPVPEVGGVPAVAAAHAPAEPAAEGVGARPPFLKEPGPAFGIGPPPGNSPSFLGVFLEFRTKNNSLDICDAQGPLKLVLNSLHRSDKLGCP